MTDPKNMYINSAMAQVVAEFESLIEKSVAEIIDKDMTSEPKNYDEAVAVFRVFFSNALSGAAKDLRALNDV